MASKRKLSASETKKQTLILSHYSFYWLRHILGSIYWASCTRYHLVSTYSKPDVLQTFFHWILIIAELRLILLTMKWRSEGLNVLPVVTHSLIEQSRATPGLSVDLLSSDHDYNMLASPKTCLDQLFGDYNCLTGEKVTKIN